MDYAFARDCASNLISTLTQRGHDARLGGTQARILYGMTERMENDDPIQIHLPTGGDQTGAMLQAVSDVYLAYNEVQGWSVELGAAANDPSKVNLYLRHVSLGSDRIPIRLLASPPMGETRTIEGWGPVISRGQTVDFLVRDVIEQTQGSVIPYVDLAHTYGTWVAPSEVPIERLYGEGLSREDLARFKRALRDAANVPARVLDGATPVTSEMNAEAVRATMGTISEYVPADIATLDGNDILLRQRDIRLSDQDLDDAFTTIIERSSWAWSNLTTLEMTQADDLDQLRVITGEENRERAAAKECRRMASSDFADGDPPLAQLNRFLPEVDGDQFRAQLKGSYLAQAKDHEAKAELLRYEAQVKVDELGTVQPA